MWRCSAVLSANVFDSSPMQSALDAIHDELSCQNAMVRVLAEIPNPPLRSFLVLSPVRRKGTTKEGVSK